MKIFVSKLNGFCSGVRHAVDLALSQVDDNVYTLGQLVHNDYVIKMLSDKGVKSVNDITLLHGGDSVIIRAHGVGKSIYDYCNKNNISVIDATCPYVKIIQQKTLKYYQDGYQIVLIGDASHPEVIGVNGWCDNKAIVFSGEGKLDLTGYEKVLILFQTTFQYEKQQLVLKKIVTDNSKTVEIFNTICYTTMERQEYANCVSKHTDAVIVVGSPNSSNTKQLFAIANKNCSNVYLVDQSNKIDDIKLLSFNSISIIAGASTPQELMREVLSKMTDNAKDDVQVVEVNEFTKAIEKMSDKNKNLKKGMKLKGAISHIDNEGVSVSIGLKKDGLVTNGEVCLSGNFEEAKAAMKVGDPIEVMVISTDNGLTLSRKAIELLYKDDVLVDGIKQGNEFSITANKAVNGGLLGKLGSYTVFVPASHIREGFVKNLDQYLGKKLRLVALEDGVDDSKRKIVASQKLILEKERKDKEENFWSNIEVGEIVEGKVLRFASFGAFVDVRGYDCLAHLSDLSWNNIKQPADVLELNKTYEFVVLKLDREHNRVSIGYKQLQAQPWQLAEQQFPVGSIVKGKVVRILPFGAFVELCPGVDGLLHISNVCWEWLDDVNKVLKVGDEIEVAVIEIDVVNKKITLSRKALLQQPVVEQAKPMENNAEQSIERPRKKKRDVEQVEEHPTLVAEHISSQPVIEEQKVEVVEQPTDENK